MRHETLPVVEAGERMLIWCEGGPYVLVDDGPPEEWHYQFVSDADVAPI